MPVPLLFIGVAAATALTGGQCLVKAHFDNAQADELNRQSQGRIAEVADRLDASRLRCGEALENLGQEKVAVLGGSVRRFLDAFRRIKNVDFSTSDGLTELGRLRIDSEGLQELEEMTDMAMALATGGVGGAIGGALMAFGAYQAATTLAAASTGTAIASLSGAAASNATLAFFGGGALAAGGLGMTGGMVILGGLVVGPALLIMGLITGAQAGRNLEMAKTNAAEATKTCELLELSVAQCCAIRRRALLFYCLLARLDAQLMPLVFALEDTVAGEGEDYALYSSEGRQHVIAAASAVQSVKAVLDTALLNDDGTLTEESEGLLEELR